MTRPPEIDSIPSYAIDNPLYSFCIGTSEMRVQRFIQTYTAFVYQRYDSDPKNFLKYTGYPGLRRNRFHKVFVKFLEKLGDADPANLVSYIFDNFTSRRNRYQERAGKLGVTYPSIDHIARNLKDYVEEFLLIKDYRPSKFITTDDLQKRDERIMDRMVKRWCNLTGKTERDYWLVPSHLLPPFLTSRDIPYAKSLWDNEDAIKEVYELSIEELREQIKALEEALERAASQRYEELEELGKRLNAKYQDLPGAESFIKTIADDEMFDRITVERIRITKEALAQGKDVTTDDFQRELEEQLDFFRPELL